MQTNVVMPINGLAIQFLWIFSYHGFSLVVVVSKNPLFSHQKDRLIVFFNFPFWTHRRRKPRQQKCKSLTNHLESQPKRNGRNQSNWQMMTWVRKLGMSGRPAACKVKHFCHCASSAKHGLSLPPKFIVRVTLPTKCPQTLPSSYPLKKGIHPSFWGILLHSICSFSLMSAIGKQSIFDIGKMKASGRQSGR